MSINGCGQRRRRSRCRKRSRSYALQGILVSGPLRASPITSFGRLHFVGFGDGRHAIGRGDAAWYGLPIAADPGTELPSFGVKASEQVISANGGQQLHDFGTVTLFTIAPSFTNFSSTMATISAPAACGEHAQDPSSSWSAAAGDMRRRAICFGCPFRPQGVRPPE